MNRKSAQKYKKAMMAEESFRQGFAAYKKGNYKTAIENFSKFTEISSNNAVAHILCGLAKQALSDYVGAIKDYSEALEINMEAQVSYYNRGLAKQALSDYTGAIKDYNKAIKINPNLPVLYNNRGTAKQALSDYKGAIEDYSKAIRIDPNDADVYYNRGNVKSVLSDRIGAVEDYSKAVAINPNDADAYYNRGAMKRDLSDYTGAIEDFSKVIDINLNYVAAYIFRGLAKAALSDYAGAVEDHNYAIIIDPNNVVAYSYRGKAKHALSDYAGAIEDYSKILEIDPNDGMTYNNRGKAKRALSDYTGAIEDYNKVIEIHPNFVEAYCNRSAAYHALGKINNAVTDWLTCLYQCIKQKKIKWIYYLLKRLDAYPQNICYAFEQLELHISSYFRFQSAIHKIADFELLLQSYEETQKLKDRELLSAKALLYYYLGGNVQSFCIYDEELDDDNNSMSAQELYYYALTAHEIAYCEAAVILDNCINQLKEKTDRTNEEYYYLGRLYLLNEDVAAANEAFEKSSSYPFSARMLKDYLEENDLEPCVLSGEIDINKGIEQFSDYFHYRECCREDAEYTDFWEAFTLKQSFNGELNCMICKEEAEEIIAGLIGAYESDAEDALEGLSKDEKANQLFEKIDDEEGNNSFKQRIEQIDTENINIYESIEYKTVSYITELDQKPQHYLYYIQYEYLRGNLTSKQAFYLTLFLRCLVNDKLSDDALHVLSDSKRTVWGERFNLNNLICIANGLLSTLEEDILKEIIQNTDRNKKAYIGFMEWTWKTIRFDKDRMTEDDFKEKWQWFGWGSRGENIVLQS
jgi:tetratricopeptide (TPR) repeat protein